MSLDVEAALLAFLASSPEQEIRREYAEAWLNHASQCDSCAERLMKRPEHAAMLMEFIHSEPEHRVEVLAALSAAENELVAIGRALLAQLPQPLQERLAEPLSSEDAGRFSATKEPLAPQHVRAAIAVAEASLALESLMSSRRGQPETLSIHDDLLEVGSKSVPVTYLIERISREVHIEPAIATGLWMGIVRMLEEGVVGLPGLRERIEGGTLLLEREDAIHPNDLRAEDMLVDASTPLTSALGGERADLAWWATEPTPHPQTWTGSPTSQRFPVGSHPPLLVWPQAISLRARFLQRLEASRYSLSCMVRVEQDRLELTCRDGSEFMFDKLRIYVEDTVKSFGMSSWMDESLPRRRIFVSERPGTKNHEK